MTKMLDKGNAIRDVILEAIERRGMTEAQCADKAGISRGFFSDWKVGRIKMPNFIKFFQICSALNISIDALNTENPSLVFLEDVRSSDDDEATLISIFRRADLRGRTEILHEAYAQDDRVKLEGDSAKTAT